MGLEGGSLWVLELAERLVEVVRGAVVGWWPSLFCLFLATDTRFGSSTEGAGLYLLELLLTGAYFRSSTSKYHEPIKFVQVFKCIARNGA